MSAAQQHSEPSAASGPGTPPRRRAGLLLAIATIVLALDVASKVAVVATLEGQVPVRLFGGGLYLIVYRNPGAAFSLGTDFTLVLSLIALAVAGAIVWFARRVLSPGWAVGLGLVLGGALGNLVDRVFRSPGPLHGHVVDFLSVFAPDGSVWPVFNVADAAIVCGAVLLVVLAALGRDHDGTRDRREARS